LFSLFIKDEFFQTYLRKMLKDFIEEFLHLLWGGVRVDGVGGHRVNKPSLSVYPWLVGLATRPAAREASGVPRRVKVERRRQKPSDFNLGDLEQAGCWLP
jgi:hypothetical protein